MLSLVQFGTKKILSQPDKITNLARRDPAVVAFSDAAAPQADLDEDPPDFKGGFLS